MKSTHYPLERIAAHASKRIVLSVVSLHTKDESSQKLDNTGKWIDAAWDRIVKIHPAADGGRTSWDSLLIAFTGVQLNTVKEQLIGIFDKIDDESHQGILIAREVCEPGDVIIQISSDMMEEIACKSKVGGQSAFEYGADFLKDAKRDWDSGDYLGAGRAIYEHVHLENRPKWATAILQYAYKYFSKNHIIDELLRIESDSDRWTDANEILAQLRNDATAMEIRRWINVIKSIISRTYKNKVNLQYSFLILAENVAKVIYNSSHPALRIKRNLPPFFDYDVGWWLPSNLASIVNKIGDDNLKAGAWRVISSISL